MKILFVIGGLVCVGTTQDDRKNLDNFLNDLSSKEAATAENARNKLIDMGKSIAPALEKKMAESKELAPAIKLILAHFEEGDAAWFPLQEKAEWTYERRSDGKPVGKYLVVRITDKKEDENLGELMTIDCGTYIEYATIRKEGRCECIESNGEKMFVQKQWDVYAIYRAQFNTPLYTFYKFELPLKKGKRWEFIGLSGCEKFVAKYEVEGVEEIEVPAGKFYTWKVKYSGASKNQSEQFWFAKGVGLVKHDDGMKNVRELKSFRKP